MCSNEREGKKGKRVYYELKRKRGKEREKGVL